MDFNLSQQNSVFMPGLTSRGAVYNADGNSGFGALPPISTPIKLGLIAAVIYFGMQKKIPLPVLGAVGFGIFKFFPDAVAAGTSAPVTTNLNPTMPIDINPGDLPTMPGIAGY